MTERVRIGIFGTGRIGRSHARTLAFQTAGAELVVVCDVNEAVAKQAASACRVERWTADVDAVMSDPNIDAVVIASSTDSHAPLIIQAAQAKKDIFTEKPV